VEAIGKDVAQFQPGEKVFGDLSAHGFGAFAEYISVPEEASYTNPLMCLLKQQQPFLSLDWQHFKH